MKTAQELGISDAEHIALQAVAAGLASGMYVHKLHSNTDATHPKTFCMDVPFRKDSCGTVGCIGGWAALEMGMSERCAYHYVMGKEYGPLVPLYFPNSYLNWNLITPAIAAEAIYQFLDGKPVDYPALLASSLAA